VQDGNDLYDFRSPLHDRVLIDAKEEDIQIRQVGTPMVFAGNLRQFLEGVHQFNLNPVGNGEPASPSR
jgi:hypothetical protein